MCVCHKRMNDNARHFLFNVHHFKDIRYDTKFHYILKSKKKDFNNK